ncbi:hypothetical protein D6851_15100 [Altericroceibacterium spongiae]|uniref:Uncharacterized protein n=1 Tax=Altericroceibacterium spongiae TaxID=2320269 RepID=A0A420EC92_9SPHN|nr:hypothetical protein [Altericroceibacterium spongiae]RKF18295.1 hypothetical protein D6851_15100 [Altericroceibacterium spongiae]
MVIEKSSAEQSTYRRILSQLDFAVECTTHLVASELDDYDLILCDTGTMTVDPWPFPSTDCLVAIIAPDDCTMRNHLETLHIRFIERPLDLASLHAVVSGK